MPAAARGVPPRRLTFVTTNPGKVAELDALVRPAGYVVAQWVGGYPELQADTLAEVTAFGAKELLAAGLAPPFILEDSGLFVDALKGFPGVYGRHALDTIGCSGLLRLMDGLPADRRSARFASDLLLVGEGGSLRHFEGLCPGRIAEEAAGEGGFGFDPVFVPAGRSLTFAQITREEKNRLSHRGQAARRLLDHLIETAKP